MKFLPSILVLIAIALTGCSKNKRPSYGNRTVKIMPVGDSITAGENYGHPPINERTGYRQPLYNLLKSENYNFDFVGSTQHGKGISADKAYDWNSESYPGWDIPKISKEVLPKLSMFQPDVLLVHMGTNGSDWDQKPGQLAKFLDGVDSYAVSNNKDVVVLVALIINHYEGRDRKVSAFNQRVREMVPSRKNQRIQVKLVNMERGAGIDYSDKEPDPATGYAGGDMMGRKHPKTDMDRLHPNDRGYKKMAVKWFQALKPYLN